jgi:hypothetical protein
MVYPAKNQGGFKKMHNETLASEIIKDVLDEKREIIDKLDLLDVDFEKALFCVNSAWETLSDMKEPKTMSDALVQYVNTRSVFMNVNIIFDYLVKIQTNIGDIVAQNIKKNNEIREKENGLQENDC